MFLASVRVALPCAAVLFSTGVLLCRQIPPPQTRTKSPEMWEEMMGLLQYAMKIRTEPLAGFEIPSDERDWNIKVTKLRADVAIATYSTAPQLTFSVQTIFCSDKVLMKNGQDATILGSAETAAEFYKSNTSFLAYDPYQPLVCSLPYMEFSERHTNDPNVIWVTSHGRAIRHMSNWIHFLSDHGQSKRAAEFFVTALSEEQQHLEELTSDPDHSKSLQELELFGKLLPRNSFLQAPALSDGERAQVRAFVQITIQIRKKLRVFAPSADQEIQQDEKLLAQYR
jgi:hypothetical protein